MADLVRVQAENFRAYRQLSLDLRGNGLVLIAGPNNVGKSALLSTLDVVAGTTPPDFEHRGLPPKIRTTWQLQPGEREQWLIGAPEDVTSEDGLAEQMAITFGAVFGAMQPVAVSVSSDGGWLELGRFEAGQFGQWKIQSRSVAHAREDGQSWRSSTEGGHELHDTLPNFGLPAAQRIIERWRAGYFHFQPLRQASGRTADLQQISPNLATDGSNLATVLLHLQTNRPGAWARLKHLIREIIPDAGDLMTPVLGNQCEIVFQDVTRRLTSARNLKDLGTGVEQLLMLLVVGLTQEARTIVLEDPEIGLHASAQRALLGLLQDWSRNRVILGATHSAAMLDWTSPATTVIAVRRRRGESEADVVTTERAEVLRELGIRLSDVLSADRLLVLEGPTDRDVLDVWFAETLRQPRVVVLNGGGGADSRHADLLASWLENVDQLGQRRVLYVRDRDELSEASVDRLQASGNVFVLPVREVENLLLNAEAVANLINGERRRQDNELVSVAEVSGALRAAADGLKQTVVLKRVMAELDPIRLVDNKLRGQLAKAQAGSTDLVAAVTERIPLREAVEARIATSWSAHEKAVEDAWNEDWAALAPGADVLSTVMQQFLARGYSKGTDGPALARHIGTPPEALREIFDEFMAGPAH